jgi:hypothetical protein
LWTAAAVIPQPTVKQDELMIHEFAHHRAADHYSEEFHEACCELGAKLKQLAMEQPAKMAEFTKASSDDHVGRG